jgi:XTP/dITP diphosphohydrolase
MDLLVATGNPGKCREMRRLLSDLPVRILTLDGFPGAPEVIEDRETLEGNAAKKAAENAQFCGLHTVADDSGIFVDALDGRPGVRSARYADGEPTTDNLCGKLLREMKGVPEEQRNAHFRCCIAMADPEGHIVLRAEDRCDGIITHEMAGEGGFGYDPVFYYEPAGRTFAQMAPEEKNAVSHRGCALRKFRRWFTRWLKQKER